MKKFLLGIAVTVLAFGLYYHSGNIKKFIIGPKYHVKYENVTYFDRPINPAQISGVNKETKRRWSIYVNNFVDVFEDVKDGNQYFEADYYTWWESYSNAKLHVK